MYAMTSSDVRKDWSSVMDSVVRDKPVFVKRVRDTMMLASTETVAQLVSDVKFEATAYTEDDGSVTLSLNNMDIAVNGKDMDSAKSELIKAIVEYAQEYYDDFALYSHALNRRAHLPYVMKALTAKSAKELEGAVVCRNGKI